MNIWLPIVTNIIIATLLVCGIFVGKKNGWISQLVKIGVSCAAGVGIYFLTPVITNALCKIPAFVKLCVQIPSFGLALNSLLYLVLFMFVYGITCLICRLVRKSKENKNKVKTVKVKRVKTKKTKADRKLARENKKLLRRQLREKRKQAEKAKSKTNKIVGAILGVVMALIVGFVVFMPFKYIFTGLAAAQPGLEQITTGYEYTPYGQLDKLTGIVDKINHIN